MADPLADVAKAYGNVNTNKDLLYAAIAKARQAGYSWQDIGDAMGITWQGAARYGRTQRFAGS